MVQPEVVAKATAILGLQVFSLKIYNLSWGKRCHNPWFKQRSRWKNSRATIFHTEMVKMITWGHAQGPTKRGFRLKTRDQKWGEMRSKYSCLLLYYMKYSVFFGKSWIVSQQTESGRICFFQIKGKCTLFGGPRKFMRYRWIITWGCKWRFSSGFPTTTNDVLLLVLTMASWESFASQHLYLFHSLVDTRGCRFGPEKIPPPGPLGTHQYLDPYQTIWKPALFPKMYRRLISNLDTHQKTKNPPETKPIGIRETYVRKHSDGKTPLTWAGVLHSWRTTLPKDGPFQAKQWSFSRFQVQVPSISG